MNPREFTNKWGQFTSHLELTEEDILAMEQLMEADAVLRAEVAEDHQLHRVLQSVDTIHGSQEEFVSGVMAACTGVDNPVAPLVDAQPDRSAIWSWKTGAALCVVAVVAGLVIGGYYSLYSQLAQTQQQSALAMQAATRAQEQAQRAAVLSAKQAHPIVERVVATKPPISPPVVEPQEIAGPTVATVSANTKCVWEGGSPGKKLTAGEYELVFGEPMLRMPGGSLVNLKGPTRFTLHHAGHMTLHRGDIEVQVAPEDIGFRVSTPNSRVIDLGTRFKVSVDRDGRSRVRLDLGEVAVLPWHSGVNKSRHYLRLGEYEEAVICSESDGVGLVGSYLSGPSGFEGTISLGGNAFKLGSLQRFSHVYEGIAACYRNDPAKTRTAWQQAEKILERVSVAAKFGSDEQSFAGLDGLVELEERFVVGLADTPELSNSNEITVTGAIVVAGRRYPFRSVQQYEDIRGRVLQPLRDLGVPTFAQAQAAADRKTNPFRSFLKQ